MKWDENGDFGQNPYDQRFENGLKSSKLALETQSSKNAQNRYKGWSVPLVAAIAFSPAYSAEKPLTERGGVFGPKSLKLAILVKYLMFETKS